MKKKRSSAFLDTSTSVRDNQIIVDLYKKPTERCQYSLPSSCHPPHITENIPFSLAYRIIRICSETTSRDLRLQELKDMLISRSYKPKLVDLAIDKAKNIPRGKALERVEKVQNQSVRRPVFSVELPPCPTPSTKNSPKTLESDGRGPLAKQAI